MLVLVIFLLDGSVLLSRDLKMATEVSVRVPHVRNGVVEVAFLERVDRMYKTMRTNSVHIHFIRYVEVHPPTLEGATIH